LERSSKIRQQDGEALAVLVDVTSTEKTRAMAQAALNKYGCIDVLINNAGLYTAIKKQPFLEIPVEVWDRVMAVNVKGFFYAPRQSIRR
jgi:3-oxoacyl-[acyl-carrier protein] reductase